MRVLRRIAPIIGIRSFTNSSSQQLTGKEKWDIFSAVSLERKPLITRDLNEIETKFSKLLLEIEYERSHKSDFEIRLENDEKRAQEVKQKEIGINEMDGFPQQTGQDFLDASIEELKSFKPADRNSNIKDTKSLKRALDRYLLLLVNEKIGQKQCWVLPQGQHRSGETMRQTAERILKEKCGDKLNVKFMGNAPCGFYKYRYPKSVRRDKTVGAKIFFYKAALLGGDVDINKDICSDYKWATRVELGDLPYEYLKSVKMFLIDEEH